MTEKEKCRMGKLYDPFSQGLPEERRKAHELCQKYNSLPESDEEGREAILNELLGEKGENVYLQGPIQFDFGTNIKMGKNSYANFNFVVLDENTVDIGDNVFIGPNCSLVTAIHPLCFEDRNIFFNEKTGNLTNMEYSKPIKIGDNVWFGSNVTVIGGVTIGAGCVIGAGSVVTKNIPENSLAFGNPCKVYRKITQEDRINNHPELF